MSDEQKKKTDTVSFRMDLEIIDKLKKESESQGISLNVLANKIFSRYVEWDMFEPKVGMIPVAKPIVQTLFQKMSKDETIKMAEKIGHETVSNISIFMKGTMDLDSFVTWFVTRMEISDFDMNHTVKGDLHTYIIKHDLGFNWSLYHKTVLELIFNNAFEKRIDSEINDNMMKISFER